jgi:Fe-S cluster assembly ATP-binding protein
VNPLLSIKKLFVDVEKKQVLNGITLDIQEGQLHAIMGPNGSGKSSLSFTIMGHPKYTIQSGEILFENAIINSLSPDKRAKLGIFLAMQHPVEIEGISLKDFLRQAYNAIYDSTEKQLRLRDFEKYFNQKLELLNLAPAFAERHLNVGFSGGEKKVAEMLQLAVLQPKLAILDEIDSGLDIDALKNVCNALNVIRDDNPSMAVLLITHYKRILEYLSVDSIHVLQAGTIVRSGGPDLADELEQQGYE